MNIIFTSPCIYPIIIITIVILIIINIINSKKNNNNNNEKNDIVIEQHVFDGSRLVNPAQRRINIIGTEKRDCNSNLIQCTNTKQCIDKCFEIDKYKPTCSDYGLCIYKSKNATSNICQNGGRITSYFSLGRMMNACICPDTHIGLYCQIPNQMKRADYFPFFDATTTT